MEIVLGNLDIIINHVMIKKKKKSHAKDSTLG